jgi:hypothetical protein
VQQSCTSYPLIRSGQDKESFGVEDELADLMARDI